MKERIQHLERQMIQLAECIQHVRGAVELRTGNPEACAGAGTAG